MSLLKPSVYYIIVLILGIFMIGLTSAGSIDSPDDVIKLGNGIIDYKKPCFNNGLYCSSLAECNVTIFYPNNSILINNKLMTNKISYHNYTINLSDSCAISCGIYKVDISCTDITLSASQTFYVEINPTGIKSTAERSSAITRSIWIVFCFAVLLFVAFLVVSNTSAKFVLIILSFIFILAGIQLVSSTLNQEVVDPSIIGLFDFISAAAFYFYWLGAGLIVVVLILTVWNTMNEKYNNIKLGKFGGNENIGN